MPRYALVDLSSMTVLNVETRSSVLAAPPGFRNIVENTGNPTLSEWTPGDDPVVGDIWDGAIPAGFAPPAPITGLPTTMPEAWQVVLERKAALQEAEDNFTNVAGLP